MATISNIIFSGNDITVVLSATLSGVDGYIKVTSGTTVVYDNTAAITNPDIPDGSSQGTITLPFVVEGSYVIDYVEKDGASVVGDDSYELTLEIPKIKPCLEVEVDCYAPTIKAKDTTNYEVNGFEIEDEDLDITHIFPQGSGQPNFVATSPYTTGNVWTGANQLKLSGTVTYSTAEYHYIVDIDVVVPKVVDCSNTLCDLFCCLEGLRQKVEYAYSKGRQDAQKLQLDYAYSISLLQQYREAVRCGNDIPDGIVSRIKAITNCKGNCGDCKDCGGKPVKVIGIQGTSDGYISDVSLVNNELVFVGVGDAFSGSIDLSVYIDYISNIVLSGTNLSITGVGDAFSGNINLLSLLNDVQVFNIVPSSYDYSTSVEYEVDFTSNFGSGKFTVSGTDITTVEKGNYLAILSVTYKNNSTASFTTDASTGAINTRGESVSIKTWLKVDGVENAGMFTTLLSPSLISGSGEPLSVTTTVHGRFIVDDNDVIQVISQAVLGGSSDAELQSGMLTLIRLW